MKKVLDERDKSYTRIKELLRTIYLGDRYCEEMKYDKEKKIFLMKINCISRIKNGTKNWNYHTDGDIDNGCIIFEGVYDFKTNGIINDQIDEISIKKSINNILLFEILGGYVDEIGNWTTINITFNGENMYLLNPKFPDIKIYD